MKLISWNVNGLRACLTHGFADSFAALDADIFSVDDWQVSLLRSRINTTHFLPPMASPPAQLARE